MNFFLALTLLVFQARAVPVCSYTGIAWNLDLDCTNCEHIVSVDSLGSN